MLMVSGVNVHLAEDRHMTADLQSPPWSSTKALERPQDYVEKPVYAPPEVVEGKIGRFTVSRASRRRNREEAGGLFFSSDTITREAPMGAGGGEQRQQEPEDQADSEPKLVVVLFGWLNAQDKNLAK